MLFLYKYKGLDIPLGLKTGEIFSPVFIFCASSGLKILITNDIGLHNERIQRRNGIPCEKIIYCNKNKCFYLK